MDIGSLLQMAAGLAVAVERIMEVVKVVYLKLRKLLFPKNESTVMNCNEKLILTITISIISVFIAGKDAILPIPGVISLSLPIQQVITGLIISMGSGILHTLYTIFTVIKENMEIARDNRRAKST